MQIKLRATDEALLTKFSTLRTKRDIANLLEVKYELLNYILYNKKSSPHYKKIYINKKSGGKREIMSPISSLKILQTKLNYIISLTYRPKKNVHGFAKDRSILTNAAPHLKKKVMLNVDILDFFPTINFGRVRGMFIKFFNFSEDVSTMLAQICCHEDQLPQGAPTSPLISNLICAKMDKDLIALAKKHSGTYTRYADDITFSFTRNVIPNNLEKELQEVIEKNGFSLNSQKSRLLHRNKRLEVTGIIVNEKLNVKRNYIRQIRAMLHAWETFGLEQAQEEYYSKYYSGNKYPSDQKSKYYNIVKGKINHLRSVRGNDDNIYQSLAIRYNHLASIEKDKGVPIGQFPYYGQHIDRIGY